MYIVISLVIEEGGIGVSASLSSNVAPVLKSRMAAHLAAVSSGPSGVLAGDPVGAGAAGAPRAFRCPLRRWACAAIGSATAAPARRVRRSNMALLLHHDLCVGYSGRPRPVQRRIRLHDRRERSGHDAIARRPPPGHGLDLHVH